jgi:3-hydroxyisobutyryl-CoA hydrolase
VLVDLLIANMQWDPPSLAEVSKDMVDCYFYRLDELEPELELPTALREPYI